MKQFAQNYFSLEAKQVDVKCSTFSKYLVMSQILFLINVSIFWNRKKMIMAENTTSYSINM